MARVLTPYRRMVQRHFIAKPMPADAIPGWIQACEVRVAEDFQTIGASA